jgi:hypothetical protein
LVNDVVNGISNKIYKIFGNEYRVYKEKVKQGLKEPCFFITLINMVHNSEPNNNGVWILPFDIKYHPKKIDGREEMFNIGDRLINGMGVIEVKQYGPARGSNTNYQIIDGILHFFVNYNLRFSTADEGVTMNELETKEMINNGSKESR